MMNKEEKVDRSVLEIAVIGMAVRFPGAENIAEFWNNLKNGKESITFFSDADLENMGIESSVIKNPNYVKAGGFIKDIEYFDASFFSYIPAEAEIMDPQMRLFHECAWHALEDSGYDPYSYDGLIGLYAGAAPNFQWEGLTHISGKIGQLGILSSMSLISKEYLTTKISYNLNFRGPSSFVHTACSTSLVAIHWACRAILNGECHMALAGAVKIVEFTPRGYMYEKDMILAPDGHCRAFDAKAKGTVPGSGIGVVVLKRLKNALKDRDHIYAVIK
ncbi:MAG: polyketide synthase, partial [Acidobacteria bacterium]|nr:polyketide synthase [Acidobacteriota bacterium]